MTMNDSPETKTVFHRGKPRRHGLYDPAFEHDSCGVGFIANIKGVRSRDIIENALVMLQHMDHRGARGSEPNTGDGAGILTAIPHEFFARVAREELGVALPDPGCYGVGNIFLPRGDAEREACKGMMAHFTQLQGQKLLGWRRVPTAPQGADIGPTAARTAPIVEQVMIAAGPGVDRGEFCRQLFLIRKEAYHAIRSMKFKLLDGVFYICSLSTGHRLQGHAHVAPGAAYYPDLHSDDYTSHLAMVHSRFSTNTFPSGTAPSRSAS